MFKVFIIFPVSFLIWFVLVKIFLKNEGSSINVLSKKVFNNFSLIFRNILDILDSLFKSFIQIYELIGLIIKNIAGILKSLISSLCNLLTFSRLLVSL